MIDEVILGVIVSFIVGIIVGAYKKMIIPFIKENFTERVKIHDKWHGNFDFGSGNSHGIKLTLKKLGNNISGELEFTTEGKHHLKSYPIKGRFSSNILSFTYYPNDAKSTSQGSGTFERLNDGQLLKGQFAYYSQGQNKIDSIEGEFKPINN